MPAGRKPPMPALAPTARMIVMADCIGTFAPYMFAPAPIRPPYPPRTLPYIYFLTWSMSKPGTPEKLIAKPSRSKGAPANPSGPETISL